MSSRSASRSSSRSTPSSPSGKQVSRLSSLALKQLNNPEFKKELSNLPKSQQAVIKQVIQNARKTVKPSYSKRMKAVKEVQRKYVGNSRFFLPIPLYDIAEIMDAGIQETLKSANNNTTWRHGWSNFVKRDPALGKINTVLYQDQWWNIANRRFMNGSSPRKVQPTMKSKIRAALQSMFGNHMEANIEFWNSKGVTKPRSFVALLVTYKVAYEIFKEIKETPKKTELRTQNIHKYDLLYSALGKASSMDLNFMNMNYIFQPLEESLFKLLHNEKHENGRLKRISKADRIQFIKSIFEFIMNNPMNIEKEAMMLER